MKEDDNIDDIFFKGLDGKSIEKPTRFWNDISLNVLNHISKPWWTSLTTYFVGATVVTATVVTVWIVYNNQSSPQNETEKVESVVTDTAMVLEDTIQKLKDSTQQIKVIQIDTLSEAVDKTEMKEKEVVSEKFEQQMLEHSIDSNRLTESLDTLLSADSTALVKPDTSLTDSTQLSTSMPVDSLIESEVPEGKVEKKIPTVVIIQDTVVVTDTIKIDPKK
ncbi:MAG: hypothetical protein AAGI07_12155 [Bacteroidota bacterium]